MSNTECFDVAIVGGGPAGLSAAIFLGRYLHSVVLIDSGDPRNWETIGVNGYLGLPRIRPADLRERGRAECRRYDVTLVDAIATRARRLADDRFSVELESGGIYEARCLLLATGIRDVWPEIPGLERVYGMNAHVCPDCDGYSGRDARTVVIGSGRKAVGLALNLTTWTQKIVVCTNGEPPGFDSPEYEDKLCRNEIQVLTSPVTRIRTNGSEIYYLELEDGMCLDAEKLYFTMGQYGVDELGAQLGCERDDDGQVIIDRHGHTSVANVFAAGDITPGPQLAVVAAAEGATAALAIHKALTPEARKLAPQS
jgi:thioredoxin reductase